MYKRAFILCLVGMALLFGARTTARAQADKIFIDDLTDLPTVTSDTAAHGGSVTNVNLAGELLTFDYTIGGAVATDTGDFYVDLLENPGGLVSDRFLISLTNGSSLTHVKFASDPYTIDASHATKLGEFVENGTFQQVLRFDLGGSAHDQFFVRSDAPEPAPEPVFYQMSALLTLGGIGLLRLRKRR